MGNPAERPLISVIVPVYKVEQYLHACVDSILAQTYTNLEIILVDDGSPDNCGAICDEYVARDSRVKVVHKKNGGLSDARNAGMAISHGAYLNFLDSDDVLPDGALEHMLNLALIERADLVIGNHMRFEDAVPEVPENSTDIRIVDKIDAMKDFFRNGCAAWARLYRREIHEGILFPVGEINEDEAIVLPLLDRCSRIVNTNQIIYFYRYRPESITTSVFTERKMDWFIHCSYNLSWVRMHYQNLEPYAIDRLASCVVFLLDEMAKAGYRNQKIEKILLNDLRKGFQEYWKYFLSGKNAKMRMWMLRYMPFRVYCALTLLRRRIS